MDDRLTPGTLASHWSAAGGWRLHHLAGGAPAGTLTAVVLVHGLVVSSRYMVPTARLLASRTRVLAPDLPGFGASQGPRRALDVGGLAAALGQWLDTTAPPRPLLVGHSFGAQVVAELMATAPRPVHAVVLAGMTMDPAAAGFVGQAVRFLADTVREPPALAAVILRDTLRAGPLRAIATLRAALRHAVERRLPAIAAPAVVVRGGRDVICPARWAREAAALLPDATLEEVPGAPHALNFATPEPFAELLLRHAAKRG